MNATISDIVWALDRIAYAVRANDRDGYFESRTNALAIGCTTEQIVDAYWYAAGHSIILHFDIEGVRS